jgi:hypothetical protein
VDEKRGEKKERVEGKEHGRERRSNESQLRIEGKSQNPRQDLRNRGYVIATPSQPKPVDKSSFLGRRLTQHFTCVIPLGTIQPIGGHSAVDQHDGVHALELYSSTNRWLGRDQVQIHPEFRPDYM